MKVLVTGGAGFIGSHIVDLLIQNRHEVIVVDNLSTGNRKNISGNIKFYETDILDPYLAEIFDSERPECVIHQAAQANAQKSIEQPAFDGTVNIIGSINVLENCKNYGTKKIIYASSAAVYGNPISLPITEQHLVCPISNYGVSKHTVEHYIEIYAQLYGIKYTILRYANVYGPRQNCGGEGGVVSIFFDRLKKGDQVCIYGDGGQTRDFVYVKDVAQANIAAMMHTVNDTVNISTCKTTQITQLFYILKSLIVSEAQPINMPAKQGDIRNSCLDNSKALTLLGWKPIYSLETGLAEMADYAI